MIGIITVPLQTRYIRYIIYKQVGVGISPTKGLMQKIQNKILFNMFILQKLKFSIDKYIFSRTFTTQ